ncbi:CAMK family protein kinase [Tritrichomonas foetus]|uniref:non-specific serine/threonine protein kinase n=1 Tax=Tritrichomonas foetus TaxID=1144522 RepID=A0A1J4KCM5_9EUKA|nr:CAMK family protein kinase [Tritrichomonas foetus]|eukprot:OHT07205.1 CAMK family protein kinase [Tritrichomonas foetus]
MLIGKYRISRVIGDGSFSTVKLGFHIFTNEPVAVKIISKSTLTEQSQIDQLHERIAIIQRFDHPGIIKLIEVIEDETTFYVVLEYCGGGELFDFIIARKRVEEPLAKRFFKQIVLAVGYCHSQNVIHRDLKPENLLLTENNTVKLIDFGLCNTQADQPLHDRCGSACYIAPEALTTTQYYGIPADIWSLGVILYALVDGSLPWNYQDPNQMFQQITTGSFPMPTGITPQCQDILRGMLNPDASQRFNIDAILMHPWLFGVGNVFPLPKPKVQQTKEPHLNLSLGGFSASNIHTDFLQNSSQQQPQQPQMNVTCSLETIFEDNSIQQLLHHPIQKPTHDKVEVRTSRSKPIQPRSISLDAATMTEENDGEPTNTHHGPIMSQTISHRDPTIVAQRLENVLIEMGLNYRKSSPLMFHISGPEIQISAEVCRLYGFRNVYVVAFKRIQGESWGYTQFVSSILNVFKDQ